MILAENEVEDHLAAMNIDKKLIKGFIRFLKEVNLFSEWKKQRALEIRGTEETMVSFLRYDVRLSSAINYSFGWGQTGVEDMWDELYCLAEEYDVSVENAIKNKDFMAEAKTIVKDYIG